MLRVKTPELYLNASGVLDRSGEQVAEIGRRAIILAGSKAWAQAGPAFSAALEAANVHWSYVRFEGYCTRERIDQLVEEARLNNSDVIIGVGGGSALDTAKAAGERLNLPVVTVPTIAATCAAWSALTVLYDAKGRSAGYLPLQHAPKLVLGDPSIWATAPRRYLASGIADTVVKWYETAIHAREETAYSSELDIHIGLRTAKLALDILTEHGIEAYRSAEQVSATVSEAFLAASDAVIALAGLVGSITGESGRGGFAHIIHDGLTHVPQTHGSLHGEKVGFGLLAQLVLEGKLEEADLLADFFAKLSLPITLLQLGITDDRVDAAAAISSHIHLPESFTAKLAFAADNESLRRAIIEADRIGSERLAKRVGAAS